MAESTRHESGNREPVLCPSCTLRVPADAETCPHCLRALPREPAPDIRKRLVPPERFPVLRRYWTEHGKWLKVALPALFGALALWAAWELRSGLKVRIPRDGPFAIEVEKSRSGPNVLLKGTLTNRGADVPDLSLQSIGVTAEIRRRDGRTERLRVFPKSPYRGEGALMTGETGSFEIEVPGDVSTVTLRGEVVDLGEDRKFIPAGQGTRPPAGKRKR